MFRDAGRPQYFRRGLAQSASDPPQRALVSAEWNQSDHAFAHIARTISRQILADPKLVPSRLVEDRGHGAVSVGTWPCDDRTLKPDHDFVLERFAGDDAVIWRSSGGRCHQV